MHIVDEKYKIESIKKAAEIAALALY